MRRVTPAIAIACALLATLAAGCGSSGSGSSSSSRSSSSSAPSAAHASPASGGLKVDTTPKYASPSPSEPVKSGTVQIAYRDITIAPDVVRAKVGSTVKWTNEDPQKCNVTSEGGPYKFASGDIPTEGAYELKLTKPGTIHYECTYYPVTMNGTIEVVG